MNIEDILPSNQQQVIEQARFTYSPLGKAFEKPIKTIEDKGQKQIDALKSFKPKEQTKSIKEIFPEGYDSAEIKNELNKNKEYKKKVNRDNIIYYSSKEPYDFRIYKTLRSFGDYIYSSKIIINEADQEQSDLVQYTLNLNNKTRPKKAGDNSESLLNEARQIVYSLYQLKQITKKIYNNIMKLVQ